MVLTELEFSQQTTKNPQIKYFTKIHPVGATGTDERDEANNHFSVLETCQKKSVLCTKKPLCTPKTNPQL
jgi:hypothetical protein